MRLPASQAAASPNLPLYKRHFAVVTTVRAVVPALPATALLLLPDAGISRVKARGWITAFFGRNLSQSNAQVAPRNNNLGAKHMAQLKSLTFTQLPKLTSADPVVQRRNKLIVRLQQQIALVQDPNFTLKRSKWIADEHGVKQLREQNRRVRAWWRNDATGNVVLTVKYGARSIEFEKGKAAIAVGNKDKLIPTIETVIGAVQAGELDTILGHMSKTAVLAKGKRAG